MHSQKILPRIFLFIAGILLAKGLTTAVPASAHPVKVERRSVGQIFFYLTTIDLTDPKTFITIGLPHNANRANTLQASYGDENFGTIVDRSHAAVVASGTFFATTSPKDVLGNMVGGGRILKYSRWENIGTTFGLGPGNRPEMVTVRAEDRPTWERHWFSITAGPRLLRHGRISLSPRSEGFRDPHVLGVANRTAIGFPANRKKLFLVHFDSSLSLQQEATVMKAIGCLEAMNMDGGSSSALAANGTILVSPGRPLTNALVVYDAYHPAPTALKQAWIRFHSSRDRRRIS